MPNFRTRISALLLMFLSACGITRCTPDPISSDEVAKRFADAVPATQDPLSVYFIGHSLVGRDMPAFLQQLAPEGHGYESQMGWGAELEAHWEPKIELTGGEVENDHPRFRDAHAAVESGDYDVLVLTEKVDIRASVEYHKSWHYMASWVKKATAANPDVRVYFYETWPGLDAEEGWLARIDGDLETYWEREIADRAMAVDGVDKPIYMIPGGQVMAAFARKLEAEGPIDGLQTYNDLFEDGIHFNDLGAYLIALTHYAVIYGQSPVGLPHDLIKADGTPAVAPGSMAAKAMQETVWQVVSGYSRTGISP